ncbi:MAG: hypothetical protein ACJAZT_000207 [Gammaproteobacteria bacterium]|jgi:hypothetical protein
MPITFTTKSYADITMLNDVATVMLEMINFGQLVPGAIAAKDVHQALTNLQKNLADEIDNTEQDQEEQDDQPTIARSTRAVPLLKLLNSANENGNDVSWR